MEKQKPSQKYSNKHSKHSGVQAHGDRCRLLLTRRVGESIIIGNHVEVTVTKIMNGAVRLAVRAPLAVPVDRKEIRELKNKSKGQTAHGLERPPT